MAHIIIAIPGDTTRSEPNPRLSFTGGGLHAARVRIAYRIDPTSGSEGEITFSGVLECRWIKGGIEYEDYSQHGDDRRLGLIEILDSAYVAAMREMGWRKVPDQLRAYEDPVRHFRLGFEKWGQLNVIATGIAIRTIGD